MTDRAMAATLVRPPRDTRLDVVRGWLQLTIFASHAYGSFIGGWMIHSSWGLSDSSELFVFLSGYTLGSVFALKMARQGFSLAARDMLGRAWRLYRTHLMVGALFLIMLLLACPLLPWAPDVRRMGWGYFLDHPFLAVPGLLVMLYQPDFLGILPIFIWCMALLPAFAWLEARWGNWALALPIGLYAASWLLGLAAPSLGPETGISFNPFAWQLLFLSGAWLGRRSLLLGEALPRLPWLTVAAALLVAAGVYLRLGWYELLPLPLPSGEEYWITAKDNLGLPRLLHAFALAWLVANLLPREAGWMYRAFPSWLAAIGRHSLQVFCLGLFLSWGMTVVYRLAPGQWWWDPLMIVSGALILGAFARWLEGRRAGQLPARAPRPRLASPRAA